MATKSSVSNIFPQFKKFVEIHFQKPIKTLYSDNGGEFIALKSYFLRHGITHYTTAPYTPQQNDVSNAVTVTLWKRALHYFKMQILIFHTGPMLFKQHPTL
jgi:transposase InsO family protein